MTQINAYDDYGIPQGKNASGALFAGGTATNNFGRFGYTGQAWLPEVGLYHYKARAYSPTLGRFMQTDPIGYGDGVNLYAYVKGDPINNVDPSGLKGSAISADDVEKARAEGFTGATVGDFYRFLAEKSLTLASLRSTITVTAERVNRVEFINDGNRNMTQAFDRLNMIQAVTRPPVQEFKGADCGKLCPAPKPKPLPKKPSLLQQCIENALADRNSTDPNAKIDRALRDTSRTGSGIIKDPLKARGLNYTEAAVSFGNNFIYNFGYNIGSSCPIK